MSKKIKVVYPGKPVPKPRMTRKDKWMNPPRDCVANFWKFRDGFILLARNAGLDPDLTVSELSIRAYFPIPRSWSKDKKSALAGKPHMIRPGADGDNIVKAVADSVASDDMSIWRKTIEKYWDDGGGARLEVEITAINPAFVST
jgi:Holliday junction resolvase RusA-like endonuclease